MTWTCEQIESRLTDYLDGILDPAESRAFDAHVQSCDRCAPLVASVSQLLTNLHSVPEIEEPPRLVYNILDKTLGPRESAKGWRAALAWWKNLASPRFAYGSLTVAATFLLLVTVAGFNWRHPKVSDLSPVNIYHNADRQVHLVYARSSKFVSDLRVVYEIQSRLRQDNQLPTNNESVVPQAAPEKQPGTTDNTPSSPRQQNRANDLQRQPAVLSAMSMRPRLLSALPEPNVLALPVCTTLLNAGWFGRKTR